MARQVVPAAAPRRLHLLEDVPGGFEYDLLHAELSGRSAKSISVKRSTSGLPPRPASVPQALPFRTH
jgi:hypothetical protein